MDVSLYLGRCLFLRKWFQFFVDGHYSMVLRMCINYVVHKDYVIYLSNKGFFFFFSLLKFAKTNSIFQEDPSSTAICINVLLTYEFKKFLN